jgi:hypothetical protein
MVREPTIEFLDRAEARSAVEDAQDHEAVPLVDDAKMLALEQSSHLAGGELLHVTLLGIGGMHLVLGARRRHAQPLKPVTQSPQDRVETPTLAKEALNRVGSGGACSFFLPMGWRLQSDRPCISAPHRESLCVRASSRSPTARMRHLHGGRSAMGRPHA